MKSVSNFLKNLRPWRVALALLSAALVSGFSGCQTPAGSPGFAAVEISGRSGEEILQTTAAVFRDDGYILRSSQGGRMVFERDGSALSRLAYGDWGGGVVLRVRAQVVPLEPKVFRLQARASMVRGPEDRVLEDEQQLANFRRGPFQKLLEDVAHRLK